MKNHPKNNTSNHALTSYPTLLLRSILILTAVVGFSLESHAAVIAQWGGNVITTTTNLVLPTAVVNGGISTYPYSASTPISPSGGGYTGGLFYGAIQNNNSSGTPLAFSRARVQDNGASPDEVDIWGSNTTGAGQTNTVNALIFFKPNLTAGQSASFTSGDSLTMGVSLPSATSKELRFAVENNGVWYLSQTNFTGTGSSFTIADASLQLWGVWDPTGSPLSSTPTTFTTLGSTFTDIQGIGFYAMASRTGSSVDGRITMTSFLGNGTITTVPEPSTCALVFLAGCGIVISGLKKLRRI